MLTVGETKKFIEWHLVSYYQIQLWKCGKNGIVGHNEYSVVW